jgi:hypothetical protein
MIREIKIEDIKIVAVMLRAMYLEVFGYTEALTDLELYEDEIVKCMADNTQTILVDDSLRGFFIVQDISEPMLKTKRYQGTRVYIHPKHRKGKLLKEFYDYLFENFDGIILGNTEITSEHIKVMDKRHELVSKVYKLRR